MSKKFIDHTPEEQEAIRSRMSKTITKYWALFTPEQRSMMRKGVNNVMFGKKHSVTTRQKMSSSQRASCFKSPANFCNIPTTVLRELQKKSQNACRGIPIPDERKARISYALTGEKNGFYGKHHSDETKAKLRQSHKDRKAKGEKFGFANMPKEKLLAINKATQMKAHARPNKTEAYLFDIINEACPHQYKYTGDASVTVAGMYPDFFNINGQKKVIEMFGDFYHDPKISTKYKISLPSQSTELGRIAKFKSFGFQCLVIWEHDIREKTRQFLVQTIREFNDVQNNE